MNKEQTEKLIDLVLCSIIFAVGIISANLFYNGVYDPYLYNVVIFLQLIVGTVMAILLGGCFDIISLYGINDDKKEAHSQ